MENKLKGGYNRLQFAYMTPYYCLTNKQMLEEIEIIEIIELKEPDGKFKKKWYKSDSELKRYESDSELKRYKFKFYTNPSYKLLSKLPKSEIIVNNNDNTYEAIEKIINDSRLRFTYKFECLNDPDNDSIGDYANALKKETINKMVELLNEKLFNEKNNEFVNMGFKTCRLDSRNPGYCVGGGGRRKKSVRKSSRSVRKSRKQRKSTRRVRS